MDSQPPFGASRDGRDAAPEASPASAPGAREATAEPTVPAYLRNNYYWAYLNPRNARLLDHETVVKTILWFQHDRLRRAAFAEFERGQHVLQSACVYGRFSPALAQHLGPAGKLEIVDIAPVQVANCQHKLRDFPNSEVHLGNVINLHGRNADAACCYFLLHELPDTVKSGAVSALLDSVKPGGKVVFIDYHKPHWAHPLKYVTSLVFELLEPYAKALWSSEIESYAASDPRYRWTKTTYFGGLYQKVVATRIA